ncbi:MAG TPA: hypothetical protein VFL64_06280 [Rhizobacter sp.]|nr:hypothetical protein [Rhizobacter sp.]
MKKSIASAAVALAMAGGAAHAVEVRGVVGGGFTFGGDTLATVRYENNDYGADEAKVHAGGLIAFNAGIELRFTDLVSGQVLVGYHFDRANGDNGNVRFERFPIEFLGHFKLTEWFRVGGGLRYTNKATLRASGAGNYFATDEDFKPSYGGVVEGEFFPLQSFGIKVRYVSEKFKSKTFPQLPEADGSHGGVYFNYYF